MNSYKQHRDLLLVEEYRILTEKTDRLTSLIWYLSTGVFTVIGAALFSLIIKVDSFEKSIYISIPSIFLIIFYILVCNRWNKIITIHYSRLQQIENYLHFYGHRAIRYKDTEIKPKCFIRIKCFIKSFRFNSIKSFRLFLSGFLICCFIAFCLYNYNDRKSIIDKYIFFIELQNKRSSPVKEIKLSKTFELYFSKGSLLVEENYLSNKETINELTDYLNKMSEKFEYKAIILGFASVESINSNNDKVSNNYELSKARAENIKIFINGLMLNNSSRLKKIEYFCGGVSNQKSFLHEINKQRKVEITFYEVLNTQGP